MTQLKKPQEPGCTAVSNPSTETPINQGTDPAREVTKRKFFRTTYEVTVLSVDEPYRDEDLYQVAYEIDLGDCVGDVVIQSCVELTTDECSRLLVSCDPGFFGLEDW